MSIRRFSLAAIGCLLSLLFVCISFSSALAISGAAGSIQGKLTDKNSAVIVNATIELHNVVTGLSRSTTSDATGNYTFLNVPPNSYHMVIKANGYAPRTQDVDVQSSVPVQLDIMLNVATS